MPGRFGSGMSCSIAAPPGRASRCGMTLPANGLRTTRPAASSVERERVVDGAHPAVQHRLAEVAAPLELGRHRAHDRQRPLVVPLLERREARRSGSRLIGPPSVPPYICSSVPRSGVVSCPGAVASVGSVIEFMLGIAEVGVAGAAAAVGARLHVQADDAAEAVAVLGVDAVLRDRDLLDRVHRRRVGGLEAGAERHAVEQHVVGAAGAAAGVVVVGVGVVVRPVLVGRRRHRASSDRAPPGCRGCGRRSAPDRSAAARASARRCSS